MIRPARIRPARATARFAQVLPLALLLASTGRAAADELDDRLASLGSMVLAERNAAELELVRALAPEDGPRTAAFLAGADLEATTRLVRAAGRSPFGLDLALSWLESDAAGSSAGDAAREVVRARIDAWRPGLERGLEQGAAVADALERLTRDERIHLLRVQLERGLTEAVDALAIGARPAVGLLLDPRLGADPTAVFGRSSAVLSGTWDDLLEALARRYGLELELASADPERELEPRRPVFLRLTAANFAGRDTGVDAILGWFGDLASDSADVRFTAARALGALGWPECIACFARRGEAAGRAELLEGARVACERGNVPSAWWRPDALRSLLARVDAHRAAGEHERADAWLRAIAAFPRRAADGADLLAVLLEEARPDDPARCVARLELAAHWAAGSAELDALCTALLRDATATATLRVAALSARARCAPHEIDREPLEVLSAGGLVADTGTVPKALGRARLMRAAEVVPVPSTEHAGLSGLARGALLLALDGPVASAELARLCEDEDGFPAVEEVLRQGYRERMERGDVDRLRALFDTARSSVAAGPARDRLDRLALACGLASEASAERLARDLLADPDTPPHLLAALVATRQAQAAEQRLLGRWSRMLADDRAGVPVSGRAELVAALADAFRTRMARGEDLLAGDLRRAVLIVLRQGTVPEWADSIRSGPWPLPAGLSAVDAWPRFTRPEPVSATPAPQTPVPPPDVQPPR